MHFLNICVFFILVCRIAAQLKNAMNKISRIAFNNRRRKRIAERMIVAPVSCSAFVATATPVRCRGALLSTDAAKAAWLARLDAPRWRSTAAVRTVIDEVGHENAKKARLASLDTPSCTAAIESVAVKKKITEGEAKTAWLEKLETPSWGKISEQDAKAKWLAKLDAPVGGMAKTMLAATDTRIADMPRDSASGEASDMLAKQAKMAWLAKLDAPLWHNS